MNEKQEDLHEEIEPEEDQRLYDVEYMSHHLTDDFDIMPMNEQLISKYIYLP